MVEYNDIQPNTLIRGSVFPELVKVIAIVPVPSL